MSRRSSKTNLSVIDCGPSRETARVIEIMKTTLRKEDIRAVAFVMVKPDGSLVTGWAGSRDGHHYAIGHGISMLQHRFHSTTVEE